MAKKINEDYIKDGAKKITEEEIGKAFEKIDVIKKKASHGALKKLFDDIMLLIGIVKDYYKGNYKEIPWWAISAIVFALLYVFNPFDLIPDFIPFFGLLDDAAVVALCLAMVHDELQKYKEWRENTPVA